MGNKLDARAALVQGLGVYSAEAAEIIVPSNVAGRLSSLAIYRHVSPSDLGYALAETLEEPAEEVGVSRVADHLSFHNDGSWLIWSLADTPAAVDATLAGLGDEADWVSSFGTRADHLAALRSISGLCPEVEVVEFEGDVADISWMGCDRLDMSRVPVLWDTIDHPLLGHVKSAFDIEVTADLVHHRVTFDIRYMEPVTIAFKNLPQMRSCLLDDLDRRALTSWGEPVANALAGTPTSLRLRDDAARAMLMDATSPCYHEYDSVVGKGK